MVGHLCLKVQCNTWITSVLMGKTEASCIVLFLALAVSDWKRNETLEQTLLLRFRTSHPICQAWEEEREVLLSFWAIVRKWWLLVLSPVLFICTLARNWFGIDKKNGFLRAPEGISLWFAIIRYRVYMSPLNQTIPRSFLATGTDKIL